MSQDWQAELLYDQRKDGSMHLRRSIANAVTLLGHHPDWRGVLAYDAFRGATVCLSAPPWHEHDAPSGERTDEWTDADTTRTLAWLARTFNVEFGTSTIDAAVEAVAHRTVVHPVRDWLRSLTWDARPRLDAMLATYFGAEDSAYTRGVGARWMIGAVARVHEPGAKVDCTLVLEGPQGIGKSTGLAALAGEWFSDTSITIGDKDSYQALRGVWIYELAELDSLSRAEINKVKAFLTATVDHYRPSYGRRTRDFPRQTVFAASTNEDAYLKDATGNRRFWPVKCTRVDVDGLRTDRAQLWAEARVRFEMGEVWHVNSKEFAELCAEEQEARMQADPWEAAVGSWLAKKGPVEHALGFTTVDVLTGALTIEHGRATRADEMRAATVLRRLGYEPRRMREGERRVRRYLRPNLDDVHARVGTEVGPHDASEKRLLSQPTQPAQPISYVHIGSPVDRSEHSTEFGWDGRDVGTDDPGGAS